MKKIIVILLLLVPTIANAQIKKPAITGNPLKDIQTDINGGTTAKPSLAGVTLTGDVTKDAPAIWAKITAANIADLTYASALAASANTPASATRKECWDAIIASNQQASGALLKNADGSLMAKPDPHIISDVESLAEIIDNLSPQGKLFTSCAGAAQLAKTNTLAVINALITGVAAFSATGGIIP